MFLPDHWYAAALTAEIGRAPFARTICGMPLVLYRDTAGAPVALEDRCAHRHAPLSLGEVIGDDIRCGYHGLRYGRGGGCTHIPNQETIPPQMRVRAFVAADRSGWVWIYFGDPAAADPARIPDFPWFDDPAWRGWHKYFPVKAAAQLFVDNLMDLGHVPFTHRNSIGAASAADAPAEIELSTGAGRIDGVRRVPDVDPGPFIRDWGGFPGRITRVSTFSWLAPSNVQIRAEFGDGARAITVMVINPITPETDTTAHFWIGWARDFRLDDAALSARTVVENTQVIEEDIVFVEAQQRRMTAFPDARAVPIKGDRTVMAVHAALDRLRRVTP